MKKLYIAKAEKIALKILFFLGGIIVIVSVVDLLHYPLSLV